MINTAAIGLLVRGSLSSTIGTGCPDIGGAQESTASPGDPNHAVLGFPGCSSMAGSDPRWFRRYNVPSIFIIYLFLLASLLPSPWVWQRCLSMVPHGKRAERGVQMPGGKDIFARQSPGLTSLEHGFFPCFPSHGQAKNPLACV